jgi:hypothetical protein
MIITIIGAVVLFVGIVVYNICKFVDKHTSKWSPDWLDLTSICCCIAGGFVLFLCTAFLLINGISSTEDYEDMLYTKEVLEYRLENRDDTVVGNELLYRDVIEFNNELRSVKRWANNPWTSWFNNQKIAKNIDYIDYRIGGVDNES